MIEGGEVRLIGTLDTTSIERSQRKVSTGFDNVNAKSKNTTASLSGLSEVGRGLAGMFTAVSVAGVGALSGLAMTAPQTAGALASISASTKQLSLIAGEELAPAFEFAAEKYSKFVDFVGSGSPFSELIKDVSFLVGSAGLAALATKFVGLGKLAPVVMKVSLAIGLVSQLDNLQDVVQNKIKSFVGEESTAGKLAGAYGGVMATAGAGAGAGALIGSAFPIIGTGAGAVVGGAGGFTYGIYRLAREGFFETDTAGGNVGG